MLKLDDRIHGFTVKRTAEISDISATLYEMHHEGCGARLIYLDRADENMSFAISFKTVPEDSTGVFHIIEHSVLCGSKKFPVKEPFVELLKGSLNTFLNAYTFPDKTVYPVASRNKKDFHNLVEVYLDAVFHPKMKENEFIFMQEGHRFEIGEDSSLSINGVVYNEMSGAYSSPDEIEVTEMSALLFPDSPYGLDSGGDPDVIPTLTYEKFLSMHDKFYHPSNSIIFLDGEVELERTLELIDSYLSQFEYRSCDFEIPVQSAVLPETREIYYEINEDEDECNKSRLALGFMAYGYDERVKAYAIGVLTDALFESNESPVKKAIIDTGLCEDVDIFTSDALMQNSVGVSFKNVTDGKENELRQLFFDTVRDICDRGIERDLLLASVNALEFKIRESDYGTMPVGLIYILCALESELYGAKAESALSFSETFGKIREGIDTGYFEGVLRELFLDNNHRATLIMRPSRTLSSQRNENKKRELAAKRSTLSDSEIKCLSDRLSDFSLWQRTEDTREALSTMPSLMLSDVSCEVRKYERKIDTVEGVNVIRHTESTRGIIYSDLYFDASDLSCEDVFDFRILASLLGNLPTKRHSVMELRKIIKSNLGSFDIRLTPMLCKDKTKIYCVVSESALAISEGYIKELLYEVIYESVFSDIKAIKNIVTQLKIASEESFVAAGHIMAYQRAASYVIGAEAVHEYYSGYEAHTRLLRISSDEKLLSETVGRLKGLIERVFTRKRATLSVLGEASEGFERELLSGLAEGEACEPVFGISPLGIRREGIEIPARVAYVATSMNMKALVSEMPSSLYVAKNILSFAYLWNTVRVQGGAYGSGMICRNNGGVGFYSYRDPSPDKTLFAYGGVSQFLLETAESGEDLTRFIIGALGDVDPLTTPRLRATLSTVKYLRGVSYDKECERRSQLLSTDGEALRRVADILSEGSKKMGVCVVGGKDKLSLVANEIDTVLKV